MWGSHDSMGLRPGASPRGPSLRESLAVPTRLTHTTADAARIILEMALSSGDSVPDVLVMDHDPKFTSALFREFTRRIGSSLLVGSAYHKNTHARAERVNGVLGDTFRAFANGRKDDWEV